MIVLRHITFTCILLFALNQSVNSLRCYVCNACEDPYSPNLKDVKVQSDDLGYYCVKVWTRHYVRREISRFCPAFHVGSTGIWCCQTDYCNDGRKMISTIRGVWMSVFVSILIRFL